jgi:nucleoside 2-deoxyribosyltransferase
LDFICPKTGMQCAYEQEIEYKSDECFFVISQHTKELVNVHQFVKNYFESKGYNVHTAIYEKQTRDWFCNKICKVIQSVRFGIIELSDLRPNVPFELGFMLGLGKPVIALLNKASKANISENFSDIAQVVEWIEYDNFPDLEKGLEKILVKMEAEYFRKTKIIIKGEHVINMGYRVPLLREASKFGIKRFEAVNVRNNNIEQIVVFVEGREKQINDFIESIEPIIRNNEIYSSNVVEIEQEPYYGDIHLIDRTFQQFLLNQLSKSTTAAIAIYQKIASIEEVIKRQS